MQHAMESVVKVVHNITESLAEDLNPGDDDVRLEFPEASIIVSMELSEDMANETEKDTNQGSIKITHPDELFGENSPKCLESQVRIICIPLDLPE